MSITSRAVIGFFWSDTYSSTSMSESELASSELSSLLLLELLLSSFYLLIKLPSMLFNAAFEKLKLESCADEDDY